MPKPVLADLAAAAEQSESALLRIHRYLYPERYADVPVYEWTADTIGDVAEMVEHALAGNPRARLPGDD